MTKGLIDGGDRDTMTKRVTAAHAKAQLSDLVAGVAHRGEHYIIERRGKPVAALVSVSELEKLEQEATTSERPLGALALVGGWRDVDDEEMDRLMADIYARRDRDTGRPVELDD